MNNEKLDSLVKKFRPEFGNLKHISIVEQIGKMRRLRESVSKHAKRVKSLENAVAKKTENEKRLEYGEASLMRELEQVFNEQ